MLTFKTKDHKNTILRSRHVARHPITVSNPLVKMMFKGHSQVISGDTVRLIIHDNLAVFYSTVFDNWLSQFLITNRIYLMLSFSVILLDFTITFCYEKISSSLTTYSQSITKCCSAWSACTYVDNIHNSVVMPRPVGKAAISTAFIRPSVSK